MISKQLAIDTFRAAGGLSWLTDGQGNAFAPCVRTFPEAASAAAPNPLVYHIEPFLLGRERWAVVLFSGHTITRPFRFTSFDRDRGDIVTDLADA